MYLPKNRITFDPFALVCGVIDLSVILTVAAFVVVLYVVVN